MRRFDVDITPRALSDIADAFRYIAVDSPLQAERWHERLTDAIDSLAKMPLRYPKADESDVLETIVRQMRFESFRVYFVILDSHVKVVHVRHAARRPPKPHDLEQTGNE